MSSVESPRREAAPAHRGLRVTGLQAGVVMALAAVVAGAFFMVRPPDAYGICMSCHTRDLVNWLSNHNLGTNLTVAQVSLVFPLLTTIGVLIGASIGAVTSGEFRWRMPERPGKNFVHGVLVMNAALVAAGCSTRLALRTAAGDPLGIAGFAAMAGGVVLATYWLRWRAQR
jgi:hypothetical protein